MRHIYRLFTRESTRKSNLTGTGAVELKSEEGVKKLNLENPNRQWFRVKRNLQLVP